jgi:hypothetical protein
VPVDPNACREKVAQRPSETANLTLNVPLAVVSARRVSVRPPVVSRRRTASSGWKLRPLTITGVRSTIRSEGRTVVAATVGARAAATAKAVTSEFLRMETRVLHPAFALGTAGNGQGMSEKREHEEQPELDETELEEQNGEPLPDREAMSVMTPFVSSPEITLPVEPPD